MALSTLECTYYWHSWHLFPNGSLFLSFLADCFTHRINHCTLRRSHQIDKETRSKDAAQSRELIGRLDSKPVDVKAFKAGQIELNIDFEAGWLCRQLILLWNTVIGIIQGRLSSPHVFPCFSTWAMWWHGGSFGWGRVGDQVTSDGDRD